LPNGLQIEESRKIQYLLSNKSLCNGISNKINPLSKEYLKIKKQKTKSTIKRILENQNPLSKEYLK
jgi:hypothetical protein